MESVCSLTYARILVRTKAQNEIDVRIRILFKHGSSDVWVKESCFYGDKHSRKKWPTNVNGVALDRDENSEFMAKQWVSESEDAKEDKNEICSAFIDPLLSDVAGRFGRDKEREWTDPILMNETAGWLAVMNFGGLKTHNCLIDRKSNQCSSVSSLGCSLKRPRGRPKNMNQSKDGTQQSTQSSSKSILDAQDTWNTAKLLGISTSDEGAVIAGSRSRKGS